MIDQEILDNAPKNTSIVDSKFKFFDDVYCELDKEGEWNWTCSMPQYPIRSLVDIKRIVELKLCVRRLLDSSTLERQENAMAELEELLEEQAK